MPVLSNGTVVNVKVPTSIQQFVVVPPTTAKVKVVQGPTGTAGADGAPGGLGIEIEQSTPASTWTLAVPPGLARRPAVAVYIDGAQVITDVTADASTVTITFPGPTAGIAVLT